MASATQTLTHDQRAADRGARPLRIDESGFALLRARLEQANRDNPDFEAQRDRLLDAIRTVLLGLQEQFATDVETVLALGEWAERGVDLRTLGEAEDLILRIVVDRPELDFDLSSAISSRIVHPLRNVTIDDFLLQYEVMPLPLWQHALEHRRRTGRSPEARGVPLLVRE